MPDGISVESLRAQRGSQLAGEIWRPIATAARRPYVVATMFEEERWRAAWLALDANPPDGLLAEVVLRYREAGRHYHTLQHLGECFAMLDGARHLAERPAEIELALWFHDAVYDTRAHDNEGTSAAWAERSLIAGGVSRVVGRRVSELVLATRHDAIPGDDDTRLLVDIDLSILGAAPPRFDEYEQQVRQEYAWVPDDAFRIGRARVLSAFLERATIYNTPWFIERLEHQAQENVSRSLRALGAETGSTSHER